MGRWKGSPQGPYWDANDTGPNQVDPPPGMSAGGPQSAPPAPPMGGPQFPQTPSGPSPNGWWDHAGEDIPGYGGYNQNRPRVPGTDGYYLPDADADRMGLPQDPAARWVPYGSEGPGGLTGQQRVDPITGVPIGGMGGPIGGGAPDYNAQYPSVPGQGGRMVKGGGESSWVSDESLAESQRLANEYARTGVMPEMPKSPWPWNSGGGQSYGAPQPSSGSLSSLVGKDLGSSKKANWLQQGIASGNLNSGQWGTLSGLAGFKK